MTILISCKIASMLVRCQFLNVQFAIAATVQPLMSISALKDIGSVEIVGSGLRDVLYVDLQLLEELMTLKSFYKL